MLTRYDGVEIQMEPESIAMVDLATGKVVFDSGRVEPSALSYARVDKLVDDTSGSGSGLGLAAWQAWREAAIDGQVWACGRVGMCAWRV